MSFAFNAQNKPVSEIKHQVINATEYSIPSVFIPFVVDSINALEKRWGPDVLINVNLHGHLHNGEEGNYDTSTANITVQKAL